jgi:competence protein ComEC
MEGVSPKTTRVDYHPLMLVLGAVSLGIICDHYVSVSMSVWLPVGFLSVLFWYVARLRGSSDTFVALLLLLAAMALAGAWHHRAWYQFRSDDIGFLADREVRPVMVEAWVKSKPQRIPAPPPDTLQPYELGDRTRMEVSVARIQDDGSWREISGNSIVMVQGHLFGLLAGDRVQIVGNLVAPSPASNPGEFDFADYCRGNRILSIIRCRSPQSVQLVQQGSAWRPQRGIDAIRSVGEAALAKYISPQNAGLAAAMFLGLREELNPELSDAFRETGTIHLLVISGLNVGILAWCILAALRTGWLSHRMAMLVLVCITVCYALVTDAQPPVVRATVLVAVFCLAQMLGRQAVGFNSLGAAALIVLAINPVELFRTGTQLSFLAFGALIVVGQSWLTRRVAETDALVLQSMPPRMQLSILVLRGLWQLTIISFIVWIVVQPLVAAKYNLVTPSAIVLGPLLAIPVAIAMATGFAVMAFGWLIPPLGALCGFVCDRCLSFVVSSVELARFMPFGKYWTPGPSEWWVIGFYALLAAGALLPALRTRRAKWWIAAAMAWCSIGIADMFLPSRNGGVLQVTFLSVGHGLAVVAEFPDGKTMVYDSGSLSSPEFAARAVSSYLFSQRIRTIDQLVISHADADHYNALPELVSRFAVKEVCYTQRMFQDEIEPLQILRSALAATSATTRHISSGDVLAESDLLRVAVLHPPHTKIAGNDNAHSAVLKIDYGSQSLLLTGDLESPGLEMLLNSSRPKLDVLLVPHHGSLRSNPQAVAQWAAPKHAVISGNFRDRADAVKEAYQSVGADVFHTADCGAVQFQFTTDTCIVKPFRSSDNHNE